MWVIKDKRFDFSCPFLQFFFGVNLAVLQNIWFTYEVSYHLKQNVCVWATKNLLWKNRRCHYTSRNAQCGALLPSVLLLDQFISKMLWILTVPSMSSVTTLSSSSSIWVSVSRKRLFNGLGLNHIQLLVVLSDHFHRQILSNQFSSYFEYGWSWPAYSPGLSPCDFFYGVSIRVLFIETVYTHFRKRTKKCQQLQLSLNTHWLEWCQTSRNNYI